MKIRLLIAIFLVIVLLVIVLLFGPDRPVSALPGYQKKAAIETAQRMGQIASVPNTLSNWPPLVGQAFPDVVLFDHQGENFSFAALKGKPVLIEFIAMTCAACQAWSGAHKHGTFAGLAAQQGLKAIEDYYREYTPGLSLFDGKINFVQLVIYDSALKAPTSEALAKWRSHFQFDKHPNTYVVSGGEPLCNKDSFVRIPGFMLLDNQGIVRFDALGHTPVHNLFRQLLPAVPKLL